MPDNAQYNQNIFNAPVNAQGAYFGPVHHQSAAQPGATTHSGSLKRQICERLVQDWPDLADELSVPVSHRARFQPGRQPADLWDWLEQRGRLGELKAALRSIGRGDLADRLDGEVAP
ncbi:death domain-containing protein [Dactylosporangium sp. CS-033363]|uniref:death domain-containing protein n=1 Tax=Dactylosporangium sp. CS-033363 TaxID=3239935 RepID=UPI003D920747